MTYEKNDKVIVKTKSGETSGTIRDRFIQNTKLELDNKVLSAEATAENSVYLVEFANGSKELISESMMSMVKAHTA